MLPVKDVENGRKQASRPWTTESPRCEK